MAKTMPFALRDYMAKKLPFALRLSQNIPFVLRLSKGERHTRNRNAFINGRWGPQQGVAMRVSEGLVEDGVVVGNNYDKYNSRNPIVQQLMRGFEQSLAALVAQVHPREIHEVGCGEGYWTLRWHDQGIEARGSDFSKVAVDIARDNARDRRLQAEMFNVCNIYYLQAERDRAELVVCCEVLEHLDDPEAGLRALQRVADPWLILSVPREPLWSAMNMARGRYWRDLGNTPGHVQRWSSRAFADLVGRYFDVVTMRTPMPWTMLLCKQRST